MGTVLDYLLPKIIRPTSGIAALGVLAMMTGTPHSSSAATAAIFLNGNMGTVSGLTTAQINGLRASGFTTMILFTMSVQANGDFFYDGQTLCSGGNYVGPSNFGSLLNQCKAMPSNVYRIEMCIGGWGDQSWTNIKNIVAAQGVNSSNILARNLSALRANLPIDAICNDDESAYHVSSAVAFGQFTAWTTMNTTLCPYTNPAYWQAVKSGIGGACDNVYLQCYDGGAGNNPATWNTYFGGLKVIPGYWDHERNATFQNKMISWRNSATVNGGFYWPSCTGCNPPADAGGMLQYSDWIHTSLDNQPVNQILALRPRSTPYVLDASGAGTGNQTPLIQSTYHKGSNQHWNANYSGGQGRLLGLASGRAVEVYGASQANNAGVNLYDWNGGTNQKYTVTYKGAGFYQLVFVHSGKALEVLNNSGVSGASVVQYTKDAHGYEQQWSFRAATY